MRTQINNISKIEIEMSVPIELYFFNNLLVIVIHFPQFQNKIHHENHDSTNQKGFFWSC